MNYLNAEGAHHRHIHMLDCLGTLSQTSSGILNIGCRDRNSVSGLSKGAQKKAGVSHLKLISLSKDSSEFQSFPVAPTQARSIAKISLKLSK